GEEKRLAQSYDVSCFQLLGHAPRDGAKRAPRGAVVTVPDDLNVYCIQIEAPGTGSPRDAVFMAKTLGVHIWAAKNTPEGWIQDAQRIAREQAVPVTFVAGDEEHNTYYGIAGLAFYSHLVDIVARA